MCLIIICNLYFFTIIYYLCITIFINVYILVTFLYLFIYSPVYILCSVSDLAKKLLDIRDYNFKKLSALMKSCRPKKMN